MLAARKFGVAGGVVEFNTLTPYWSYFIFIQNYFQGSTAIQAFWLGPLWSFGRGRTILSACAADRTHAFSIARLVKILTGILAFSLLLRLFLFFILR